LANVSEPAGIRRRSITLNADRPDRAPAIESTDDSVVGFCCSPQRDNRHAGEESSPVPVRTISPGIVNGRPAWRRVSI
jgi:hypothetical protein